MKVISYQAHNVLRVSDIDFNLEGKHLFLVGGKNGQGKTSSLTALLMALCGRSGMDWPEISLKEGEDKGWVKVNLTGSAELHDEEGFTVELFLKRKRTGQVVEEFRILDSTGDEAPEPRTLLKRMYEMRAFDPLAFDRMGRKEKKALLQKLLGLDFFAENEEYDRLYAERTNVNREGKGVRAQYDGLTQHPDVPDEEVSTADLLAELENRQGHNNTLRETVDALEVCRQNLEDNQRIIEALEEKLNAARARRRELLDNRDALDALVDGVERQDEAEIRQQIKDASGINAKIRENLQREEVGRRLDELRRQSEALTAKLQEIEAAKAKALEEAEWPVPGLAFDDEGVLYNGLPFEQASTSMRTMASFRIGMALNPDLRLLVCQDGSSLDSDTLDALERLCEEEDFQVLLELVTRTAEDEARCAVVIHDGASVAS